MSAVESKDLEKEKGLSSNDDWNPVEKVILERRSVRNYKDKQVPENLVRRILEAGRFAPSAGNCQPWRFIVIRDRDVIDAIEKDIRMMCKMLKPVVAWESSPMGPVAKLMSKMMIWLLPNKMHPAPFAAIPWIADGKVSIFHGAPTVILILKDKRGSGRPEVDLGCCGENGSQPRAGYLLGGFRGADKAEPDMEEASGHRVPVRDMRRHLTRLSSGQTGRDDTQGDPPREVARERHHEGLGLTGRIKWLS
jgi:hypothetical protein